MKKREQFSKLMVRFSLIFVLMIIVMNYDLCRRAGIAMSDVAVACVTTFGGFVTCGYFTLCASRDNSKNKYGITLEEMRGKENDCNNK